MGKAGLKRKKGRGWFGDWLKTHQKKGDKEKQEKRKTIFMQVNELKHIK